MTRVVPGWMIIIMAIITTIKFHLIVEMKTFLLITFIRKDQCLLFLLRRKQEDDDSNEGLH